MRIHSNNLTYRDLSWSAMIARADYEIDKTGSRSRDHAFTVHLTGESRRQPNRRGLNEPGTKAATWDQWGVFLSMLFDKDQDMIVGSVAHPYYRDRDDFHYRTGNRFVVRTLPDSETLSIMRSYWPEDAHGDHRFKHMGVPFEQSCTKCSAVQRWATPGTVTVRVDSPARLPGSGLPDLIQLGIDMPCHGMTPSV